MWKRSFSKRGDRVEKSAKLKRLYKDPAKLSKLQDSFEKSAPSGRALLSPLITLNIGRNGRQFAAHQDVLSMAPYLATMLRAAQIDARGKMVLDLPDEDPQIFACVLEYLYKGDYSPRIILDEQSGRHVFEHIHEPTNTGGGRGTDPSTIYLSSIDSYILRDTVIYCCAGRFGLLDLKKLSLRKQGMQSAIDCATVLRSARYAYDNTPDTDAQLRAHYLALIIRCRKTFKKSGTMQVEMESGGKLWFDLYVAMCNHIDDVVEIASPRGTPKSLI